MTRNPRAITHLSPQEKRVLLAKLLQEKIGRAQTFPLSFAQQRLWFLEQLEPGNLAYNILVPVRLTGRLDRAALEQALSAIVQRHEALRTTFILQDGQPVQRIAPTLSIAVPVVDLQGLPPESQEAAVTERAMEQAQQPFDLTEAPLLRATLLKLDDTTHILLFAIHHIVSDGWSMTVLLGELATLYHAFLQGQPSPLPPLPIQYADFAVWQRQWLQGEVLEAQLNYWKPQLQDAVHLPPLPTDRPRPLTRTYRGAKHPLALSPSLTQALKTLSQQAGVTLFMTALAAFKLLLCYYSGQTDIRVGTPIANRDRAEIAGLIGFFANTLVLRSDLSGNPSFRKFLHRVQKVALGAYAHQDLPFEKLVEELQPERNLSQTPLFQVWFYLQTDPMPDVEFPGLTLKPLEIDTKTAKHDLKLGLWESAEGLKGAFEYSTDLFEATTIARLAQHYANLLEHIVAQPDTPLAELIAQLASVDRQQQSDKQKALQTTSFQKLKQIKRKAVRG